MTRNILCLLLVRSLAVTDIKKQALSGCTFIYFSSKIKNMKKLFLTSIMLASCVAASAQNIQENEAKIFSYYNFNYGFTPIPPEYTINGKGLLTINNGDSDHGGITNFSIYDDDLECITTVLTESEKFQEYTITIKREAVTDGHGNITYTGAWDQGEKEYTQEITASIEDIELKSVNNNEENNVLFLTQTLFNDDEFYEYITPVLNLQLTSKSEQDRDGDGEIDYIQEEYSYKKTGFDIKSSNGQTIQTIKIDNDRYYYSICLLTINDKRYIGVEVDDELIFYPIITNSSGIKALGTPTKIKVSPRIADKSESFTIELDETESNINRDIVVVNSAGQTVWKQNVPAGQNKVNISASNLNKGVNIIRVNGTKKPESCKVIVK